MAYNLFANNAQTQLAVAMSASATTMIVAAGTGAKFPTPNSSINESFQLTLNDAATGQVFEIVTVTAISADTFTIVRAQEGTTAAAWLAGDTVYHACTAGDLGNFAQAETQSAAGVCLPGNNGFIHITFPRPFITGTPAVAVNDTNGAFWTPTFLTVYGPSAITVNGFDLYIFNWSGSVWTRANSTTNFSWTATVGH